MQNVVCPVCGKKLQTYLKCAACENHHTFDRAREGYFYLLPPNAKKSAAPGDNKSMVMAREKFLNTGSYLPLAKRLAELICERYQSGISLLDAGTGTGYYLSCVQAHRGYVDNAIGIDISKEAARRAARANPNAFIAVASVFDMPIESACVDAAISVFSPIAGNELSRVLKSGGTLFAAVPAERHLIELRQALYDDVRPVESPLEIEGFSPMTCERLTFGFQLNGGENVSALLAMTPYVYRAPKDRVLKVGAYERMSLTADIKIYIFSKNKFSEA